MTALTPTEDRTELQLASARLSSLPTDYRVRLEREWAPPEPYRITPERWAELSKDYL